MKRIVAAVLVAGMMVSFAGCQKERGKAAAASRSSEHGRRNAQTGMPDMPKVDRKVVVSEDVAAKWKSVKLTIENKAAKSSKEYTVAVGGELDVPGTNVKVKVIAFLPDFRMGEKTSRRRPTSRTIRRPRWR